VIATWASPDAWGWGASLPVGRRHRPSRLWTAVQRPHGPGGQTWLAAYDSQGMW